MNDKRAYQFHRHQEKPYKFNFLREFVYGGVDGGITTFAVVAGATGAQFDSAIIIVLGLANLIADGFSMSVGSYLSVKSEQEKYNKYLQYERWGVENIPEVEQQEIRQIYADKGLRGKLLEQVVSTITSNKELWVEEMMKGEFQLVPHTKTPALAGFHTFISFLIIGAIPLTPFLLNQMQWWHLQNPFAVTCTVTALAFAVVGWVKAYVNHTRMTWAILETLSLGVAAAALAYYTGYLLESII